MRSIDYLGYPEIKSYMNAYFITEHFQFCSRSDSFAMISGFGFDISGIPKVRLISSTYDTATLVSSLYF